MNKILFLILASVSCFAYSYEQAKRISYEMLFVPLGESCEQYYSLNIPGRICLKGQLHIRAYEIVYEVRGRPKMVRLTYIPDTTFEVDDAGNVKPRNHDIRSDQRF